MPTEFDDTHIMFKWNADKKALLLDGCDAGGDKIIDVSLRLITPRVFKTNLLVTDSQYTCVNASLLGKNYVYPTFKNLPYFYNIYASGTYPGRSSLSSSHEPYNRICIESYHTPKLQEEDFAPGDILTGGG